MPVKLIGFDLLEKDLKEVAELLKHPEIITEELDAQMNNFVHQITGYLKSTIYHTNHIAGADAPYAGFEEERGGGHAYATRAIEAWSIEKFGDRVMGPLNR